METEFERIAVPVWYVVRGVADVSGSFVKIDADEASWNTEMAYAGGNLGTPPTVTGVQSPPPPGAP